MDSPAVAPPDGLTVEERRLEQELRVHKMRATGLLVLATLIYLAMVAFTDDGGWTGYVEATAEAAMVGGIADWFAVTALFRHPLRLPIPHTAIVPKRKDEIGRALGDFVQENFLSGDVLRDRLEGAGLANRIGSWLEVPQNAERVSDQAAAAIGGVLDVLRDDQLQDTVDGLVRQRVNEINVAPVAGRAVDFALDGGHHRAIFDAALGGVGSMLDDNRGLLRRRLESESPWWVPEQVDQKVFERIYEGVQRFIAEVDRNPDHEVRDRVDLRFRKLARDLQESPEFETRAEELKQELLAHPAVQEWTANLWLHIKDTLQNATADPDSDLRARINDAVAGLGETLRDDPVLRARVDRGITSVAVHLANESNTEVADFIASTVEGWDPQDTTERIERQIGRDLQFIRINGTLVGGLAGFVIHAVTHLLR